jgi:hypothetical protein
VFSSYHQTSGRSNLMIKSLARPLRLYDYHDQLVDQIDSENKNSWTQRYFMSYHYFSCPGRSIFLMIGGEDEVMELLYPYVNDPLAKRLKEVVLQPEHRFYGRSQPIKVI